MKKNKSAPTDLAVFEDVKISKEIRSDPRKLSFLSFYFSTESPTFGNAKQSAIRAGFSEIYADNITFLNPKWLSEFIGQQSLADLAEKHITETLLLPSVVQAMGAFGPIFKTEIVKEKKKYKNGKTRMVNKKIRVPVIVPNTSIIKEKTAIAKIVLPAFKPDVYREKKPGGVNFVFNVKAAKDRYK